MLNRRIKRLTSEIRFKYIESILCKVINTVLMRCKETRNYIKQYQDVADVRYFLQALLLSDVFDVLTARML